MFKRKTSRVRSFGVVAAAVLLAVGGFVPAAVAAPGDAQTFPDGRYIVVMAKEAVAAYDGGVPGLAPTKPELGSKVDAADPDVQKYQRYLTQEQQRVAGAKNVRIEKNLTVALNGFVASLTGQQAKELAASKGVVTVAPDTLLQPDSSSAQWLGLSGGNGIWQDQYGGSANAGKGVVVGVLDTGYTPGNPLVAGNQVQPLQGEAKMGEPYRDAAGGISMLKADGDTFRGECQSGQGFAGTECNSKVISARYYGETYLANTLIGDRDPKELVSPVDTNNHGTHTAGTAVGSEGVQVNMPGRSPDIASGVAPGAKLAVYKVCWTTGCYTSDSVQAIDQAVLDGVDVINFSISGSNTRVNDPVSLAFLSAASAGIVVSASAGNSGPEANTVNHGGPWVTTVAATTWPDEAKGTLELADGTRYRGSSIASASVFNKPLVLAETLAPAGASASKLCMPGSLDPAKTADKIVVCERGVNARVEKSQVVKDAGGVGMVLGNPTPNSSDLDVHAVPSVHLDAPDYLALRATLVSAPGQPGNIVNRDTSGKPVDKTPQIAGFSSRGPHNAAGGDILKPDLAATGVNVLSGFSPIASGGSQFGYASGTSMAAPHVAGYAAMILGKYPTASPAAVKSAMMTTAGNVLNADGSRNTDKLAVGAGQVDPLRFLSPGLYFEAGNKDYLGYLLGLGYNLGIDGLSPVKARDFNQASVAVGNLDGRVETSRTATALTPGVYQISVDTPGVRVRTIPSILVFEQAGASKTFKIVIERSGGASGQIYNGDITLSGAGVKVKMPVSIRNR